MIKKQWSVLMAGLLSYAETLRKQIQNMLFKKLLYNLLFVV